MRPGQQQNKRMRNRGGRKGPNPLSRSFESNGPDVKIRGTAQHIADKYTTLARDAAASGDRIMAENYLQHAEHYGRIVAAAQGQYMPPQVERDFGDEDEMDGEEGGADFAPAPQNERQNFGDRQPYGEQRQNNQNGYQRDNQNGRDGQSNRDGQGQRDGQPNRDGNRFDRNDRGDRGERRDRNDRPFRDRDGQRDNRQNDRQPYGDRQNNGERPAYAERQNGGGEQQQTRGDEARAERVQAPAGTGPQPEVTEGGEAGGNRFEQRRERRDRQRLQDRGGERRFEERFGRGPADESRESAPAAVTPAEPVAEAPQGVQPEPYTADAAAAMATQSETTATGAAGTAPVEAAAEPRRRGRPRRERPEVAAAPDVNGEVPIASDPSPATVSADAVPAVPASTGEEAAAPKRRPGRPRKKKTDNEGGEGGEGEGHLPAFLLASNG